MLADAKGLFGYLLCHADTTAPGLISRDNNVLGDYQQKPQAQHDLNIIDFGLFKVFIQQNDVFTSMYI